MDPQNKAEVRPNLPRFPSSGSDEDLRRAYREEQIWSRRAAGDRLMRQARSFVRSAHHLKARKRAERNARQALAAYRASLDWAEDTEHEEEAHRLLDEAGRWVRETFGCRLKREGTHYEQTCPVALGHNRIGLSVGGRAAKRVCSLCGMDASECEHLPGKAYVVPGGAHDLGWCRVCCNSECDHLPTESYRASLVSIIHEMELDEVSIVAKPAHPEARIQAMSIPVSDLRSRLGSEFEPGMDVSCDRCLLPCDGLVRHEHMPHR